MPGGAILRTRAPLLLTALIGLWGAAHAFRAQPPDPGAIPIELRADIEPERRLSFQMPGWNPLQAVEAYSELTGRHLAPGRGRMVERVDRWSGGRLSAWRLLPPAPARPDSGVRFHADGRLSARELKEDLERAFRTNGLRTVALGTHAWRLESAPRASELQETFPSHDNTP